MSLKKESLSDAQLHLAALNGDLELLRRILDSGKVHVDSRDKDGTTPLILASANGNCDCVQELLEQGADPSAKRITGTTPLFFAAQGGHLDVVKLLLDSGACVDSSSVYIHYFRVNVKMFNGWRFIPRKIELISEAHLCEDAFKKRGNAFENQFINKQTSEKLSKIKRQMEEMKKKMKKDEKKRKEQTKGNDGDDDVEYYDK